MTRHANLETVFVVVPLEAVPAYETALAASCTAVGTFFEDEEAGIWRVEGVRPVGDNAQLLAGLAMAELATGVSAPLQRLDTDEDGWLARVYEGFPEQPIGRRFSVRGTHIAEPLIPGRITLMLDAGLAFGSGEHGSTRGCLRALEQVAYRRPARILDMGCGSGILAMGAVQLLHRRALAVDIDPWSVAVTKQNAKLNRLGGRIDARRGNGWQAGIVRRRSFDLVFANILARPLRLLAPSLAAATARDGEAVVSGLLFHDVPGVLSSWAAQGFYLKERIDLEGWASLRLAR